MWSGNSTNIDILVKQGSIEKVKQKLQDNNIKFVVIIEDLQKAIDEENPPFTEEEDLNDRQGNR